MTSHDDAARVIVLVNGLMEHGGPFWCYVAVKPSQYNAFNTAKSNRSIDLYNFDHFGEVIVSAEGEWPPDDVTNEVARLYHTDPRTFFREIDPLAEIEKKLGPVEDEPSPSSWAARVGKRS